MRSKLPKQFIILTLALLVFFNGAGLFLSAYLQTGIHRMGNSVRKMDEHSEIISISNEEFESLVWVGKRDFIWNGHIYDLISLSKSGGKVNMTCAADKKEDSIRKNLAGNFEKGSSNIPASKSGNTLFKFLPLVAFVQNQFMPEQDSSSVFIFDQNDCAAIQSAAVSLNSPPPELL